jgi:hypothetical protein
MPTVIFSLYFDSVRVRSLVAYPVRRYQGQDQSARTAISDREHFNQSICLQKSAGEPPSVSMVELGVVPHKVETQLDAEPILNYRFRGRPND